MNLKLSWSNPCFGLFVPKVSLIVTTLALSLGSVRAQDWTPYGNQNQPPPDSTNLTVTSLLNLCGTNDPAPKTNITCQAPGAITIGNNLNQSFGCLTVNGNTSITEDCQSLGSQFNNNAACAITQKSLECFTGGLNINSGCLNINGWQGNLGQSSNCGQLLFANTGQTLNCEVKNVIFDLTGNTVCKSDTCNYVTPGSCVDYGEWICDPNNNSLCELVPYDCVPEPKTTIAGIALVAFLLFRERSRLARFFVRPQAKD